MPTPLKDLHFFSLFIQQTGSPCYLVSSRGLSHSGDRKVIAVVLGFVSSFQGVAFSTFPSHFAIMPNSKTGLVYKGEFCAHLIAAAVSCYTHGILVHIVFWSLHAGQTTFASIPSLQ